MINCINYGNVTGSICAGGIVGFEYVPSGFQDNSVYNYGVVNGTSYNGLVGEFGNYSGGG